MAKQKTRSELLLEIAELELKIKTLESDLRQSNDGDEKVRERLTRILSTRVIDGSGGFYSQSPSSRRENSERKTLTWMELSAEIGKLLARTNTLGIVESQEELFDRFRQLEDKLILSLDKGSN